MKRIIKILIFSILISLFTTLPAFATVTKMPDRDANGVINLTDNVSLSECYNVGNNISEINLNGHSITNTANSGSVNSQAALLVVSRVYPVAINGSGTISNTGNAPCIVVQDGNATLNGVTVNAPGVNTTTYGAVQVGAPGGSFLPTLNLTGGTKINAPKSSYGVVVSPGRNQTAEVNVGQCTITGGAVGIGTSGSTGLGSATINVGTDGSKPTISGTACGMYLPNKDTDTKITSGSISGNSGIVVAGGGLTVSGGTISGTGDYKDKAALNNNGPVPTGAGITIQNAVTNLTGTAYGGVDISIIGNPTIKSTNGNAIQQNLGDSVTGEPDSGASNSTLDKITINGGTFSSGSDKTELGSLYTTSSQEKNYVNGGTFPTASLGTLGEAGVFNNNVKYAVNNDGNTTLSDDLSDAQAIASALGKEVTTFTPSTGVSGESPVASKEASFTADNGTVAAQTGNTIQAVLTGFGSLESGSTVTFNVTSTTTKSLILEEEDNITLTTESGSNIYTVGSTSPNSITVNINIGTVPISDVYQVTAAYNSKTVATFSATYNFTVTPVINSLYFATDGTNVPASGSVSKSLNYSDYSGRTVAWQSILNLQSASSTSPGLVVETSKIMATTYTGNNILTVKLPYNANSSTVASNILTASVIENIYKQLSFSSNNIQVVRPNGATTSNNVNVPNFTFGAVAGSAQISASSPYTVDGKTVNTNSGIGSNYNLELSLVQAVAGISFNPTTNTVYNTNTNQKATTLISVPNGSVFSSTPVYRIKPAGASGNGTTLSNTGDSSTYNFYVQSGTNEIWYNGGNNAPGSYIVTATYGNYTATATISVSNSSITSVTITQNGDPVEAPITVNVKETPTMQFGYDLTPEGATGNTVVWNLTNSDGTDNEYAEINQTTGVVTFLQNTPTGNPVVLTCLVDGVTSSNSVSLFITNAEQALEGLEPIQNPYLVSNSISLTSQQVSVAGNIRTVPNGLALPSPLTYESSNPNVPINQVTGEITVYQNYEATTTITVTNPNDLDMKTSFVVNIVPANPATGVTVVTPLNFIINEEGVISPTSLNVNASLEPADTTNHATFEYSSLDEEIATVDEFGNVTPVAEGTTRIEVTATLDNGSTYTTYSDVNITEEVEPTSIELDPTSLVLTSDEELGETEGIITATVEPENATGEIEWSIEPESVATITPGDNNTVTVKAVEDGIATLTATLGETSATATIIVSNEEVVAPNVTVLADSPDYYTVRVEAEPNPAIGQTGEVRQVSIFNWSQPDQTDMDCKVATETQPGSGIFEYTFPVNDTPDHNYFINAGDIQINIYGSLVENENGNMIFSGSYNYLSDSFWENSVAATPYVQNIGFIIPTVGADTIAGTTGQATQMEGIRLSTPIEGLELEYDVHVQDIGWMDAVTSGTYAGTMHANLQMEAIHVKLTGTNASEYTVQYQAHVQNIGWMDWVADGAEAGTTGQGLQMEALRIQIVPAGTELPSNNA